MVLIGDMRIKYVQKKLVNKDECIFKAREENVNWM